MCLKLYFFTVCYYFVSAFSSPLFGQELLRNGGFEELIPCKVCMPYYGFRVRETLKNSWTFFLSDAYNCPETYIWSGSQYDNLICNEEDAWKFKHHCREINLTAHSVIEDKIIVQLCKGDFFQQKLTQKINKGSICQISVVFYFEDKNSENSIFERISFFLSNSFPKPVLTNKLRAAEAKRCNLKLVGEIKFDSLIAHTWYEKSFQFVADADYEYFFGGSPAIEFFEPERDNLRQGYILFDRLSLKLIAAPVSEELKKIALSADSLGGNDIFGVRGRFLRVKGAIFLKNSALPKSVSDLDKTASFLQKNPSQKIRIEGHTDEDGDNHYNLKLSENRANEVKNYLVAKGIKAENIETKGFGSTSPVSKLKAENRRVEIVFLE